MIYITCLFRSLPVQAPLELISTLWWTPFDKRSIAWLALNLAHLHLLSTCTFLLWFFSVRIPLSHFMQMWCWRMMSWHDYRHADYALSLSWFSSSGIPTLHDSFETRFHILNSNGFLFARLDEKSGRSLPEKANIRLTSTQCCALNVNRKMDSIFLKIRISFSRAESTRVPYGSTPLDCATFMLGSAWPSHLSRHSFEDHSVIHRSPTRPRDKMECRILPISVRTWSLRLD